MRLRLDTRLKQGLWASLTYTAKVVIIATAFAIGLSVYVLLYGG